MKILLIQAPLEKDDIPVVPLGLCYISASLREEGHDVDIYDPNIAGKDLNGDLKDLLRDTRYTLIGISIRNIDNNLIHRPYYYYPKLNNILGIIKRHRAEAKIMIGGAGFSIFAETIMKRNPTINFGVYLEGYETVKELVANLDQPEKVSGLYIRNSAGVKFTTKREHPDLESLPNRPWDSININKYLKFPYTVGVVSKSGCIFKCAYCTYPELSGRRFLFRSPKIIVDEIEYLIKKYNIKDLFFIDSIFNCPLDHGMAILREMKKRKIKIKWTAYLVEKYFTSEFMNLALETGCDAFSFSPDGIHKQSMKGLGKISTEADLYRTYHLIKEKPGARGSYSFFLNPPGMDFEGFVKLLLFYFKTRILHRKKFLACSVWYPRVYPYTSLHKYAIKKTGFFENPEDLLPENAKNLKKMFWVNPKNGYLNILYKILIRPKAAMRKIINKIRKKENAFM